MCRKLFLLTSLVLVLGLVAGPANAQEDVNDVDDVGPPLTEINIGVSDDVEQDGRGNPLEIGSSDLEILVDSDYPDITQVIGLRFVDVPVSMGGPVASAYVEFEVDESRMTLRSISSSKVSWSLTPQHSRTLKTTSQIDQLRQRR